MEGIHGLIILTGAVAVALLALIVYSFVGMARKLHSSDRTGGPGEVGFVVDTFHELVAKLKEKERELEALRAAAEDKASTIEGYNESILQSVPSGVISLDASGAIVKANAAAARMIERPAESLAGMGITDVLGAAVEPVERGELQYRSPSGRLKWLGYGVAPLTDARGGGALGRLMVLTDVTELKAYQSQAELRRRLESLGEVAAGIAHELRNPLGVIAGYMQLIEKRGDPAIKSQVEAALREVSLMDAIIADFLSFARPRTLDPQELDLGALVREAANAAAPPDVTVKFDLPGTGLRVRADETMLRQAVWNVIQNAVEALGPDPREIAISGRQDDGRVTLRIADTGCGIPPEVSEKVFLPFFTTKEKGTGLGLAIAHRAITMHRGSISAARREPVGTVFTITLPAGGV